MPAGTSTTCWLVHRLREVGDSHDPARDRQGIGDRRLLGAASVTSRRGRRGWLRSGAFGLPLDDEEREVFATIAGDRVPPLKRVRELWVAAGRRSGKSRMAAALAIYFALFVKHRLGAGERGMVLVLAMTLDQSRVVFDYVLGFMRASEVLAREIESTTRSEIRLRNGIMIAVHPNTSAVCEAGRCAPVFSMRSRTGGTIHRDAGRGNVQRGAARVAHHQRHVGGDRLALSPPGLLHAKHKRHFGVDGDDTLVVQGSSKQFNGTLDDAAIAAQQEADPTAARSEWAANSETTLLASLTMR